MTRRRQWPLAAAEAIIPELVGWLKTACTRVEVAGSIRRRRKMVSDIDVVVIPKFASEQLSLGGRGTSKGRSQLDKCLADMAFSELIHIQANGAKIKRIVHLETGIPIDIYVAQDMVEWWPIWVIRTGSAGFNTKLCSWAKKKGWKLHASGEGLYKLGKRVEFKSERGFFRTMGIKYVPPEERTDVALLQVR